MKFRGRLLIATMVLGGGIVAFQPVMRNRMESRLSEFFGAPVKIGASKISLMDGVISLENVVVYPSPSSPSSEPTKIPHAALRFDWNSVLYRNLKIENLVASDIHWKLQVPSANDIPLAIDGDNAPASGTTPLQDCLKCVDAVVQPIKAKLEEDSARQRQSHLDISSRLKSLEERLMAALPGDASVNPLRQRFVADDVKKELAMVRQAMAEDRNRRKDADKTMQTLRQEAQAALMAAVASRSDNSIQAVQQSAMEIAKAAIVNEWNHNRPLFFAALQTLKCLESSGSDLEPSSTNVVVSDALPHRFTSLERGTIRGSVLAKSWDADPRPNPLSFEIKLNHLHSELRAAKLASSVCLITKDPSYVKNSPMATCSAGRVAIPQSETTQIQMILERTSESGECSITRVQHASYGWSSLMTLPATRCLTNAVKQPQDMSLKAHVTAKLVGTTANLANQSSRLLIDIDPESVRGLEQTLASERRREFEKERADLEAKGKARLQSELMTIGSRCEQLGDEHSRVHSAWEVTYKELTDQVQQLETIYKRTSRLSKPLQQ